MLKRTSGLCGLVLLLAWSTATAGTWDHHREGFLIGFNAGGGSAALELQAKDTASISTDPVGGGAGNFRAGYAVRPDLTLGLEVSAWGRNETGRLFGVDAEVQYRLNVAAIALTWYPGGGGFYLRGGVGGGTGRIKATLGNLGAESEASGPGVLGAIGYEFRLGQKFALGPQLDFGGMKLGEITTRDDDGEEVLADFTATYVNLSVGLNWYW